MHIYIIDPYIYPREWKICVVGSVDVWVVSADAGAYAVLPILDIIATFMCGPAPLCRSRPIDTAAKQILLFAGGKSDTGPRHQFYTSQ